MAKPSKSFGVPQPDMAGEAFAASQGRGRRMAKSNSGYSIVGSPGTTKSFRPAGTLEEALSVYHETKSGMMHSAAEASAPDESKGSGGILGVAAPAAAAVNGGVAAMKAAPYFSPDVPEVSRKGYTAVDRLQAEAREMLEKGDGKGFALEYD